MVRITEQKFGVISDLLGDREDVPTLKLPKVFLPESRATFLQYGMVRTMPGSNSGAFIDNSDVKVQTPDGNPVIRHHRHVSGAGVEYVFQYTKKHVYLWNEATKLYTTMFTSASDVTLWDTVSLDGKIVSTNGLDFVQVWDETTPSTVFAALDTATGIDIDGLGGRLTAAKYVGTAEGYLWLGALTEGGSFFPRRARASAGNDLTDFDVNGIGDTFVKDFTEGSDVIKGFGNYTYGRSRILVIFKEKSKYSTWLVESLSVWNSVREEGNIGLLSTHSVVNGSDGKLYYFASDFTVRSFNEGIVSQAKAKTIRAMNVSLTDDIEGTFWEPYNQILWSIPVNAGSTELDSVIALNLEHDVWHQYPWSIRSFGTWTQQAGLTIDGLDTISASIDGLDAQLPSIDYIEGVEGFPLDLESDHSGYTYIAHTSETNRAAAVTRNLVLSIDMTDKRSLNFFKRVSKSKIYVAGRSTTGTLALSVKKDNEPSFTLLSNFSIESAQAYVDVDVPFDIRAKHFLYKIEGTILFDFIGQFWTFEADGEY